MKNIVITGSTRGIGLAMAKEFLKAGCNVSLSGRGGELSENAKEELAPFKSQYIYIPCNVQNQPELQNLWDNSVEKWGQVDIWINNAGQNAPHEYVYNTQPEYIRDVVATNITGMIYGSQVAANGMIAQNHGAIYSMEGLGSNDMIQKKTIVYGTTKRALTYFMKGLEKELEETNIIAGRLSPGMMLTDFITKSPDGEDAAIYTQASFKKVFNILADKPETVAEFFIPRILRNTKNGKHIVWLTTAKTFFRFLKAPFVKRDLI